MNLPSNVTVVISAAGRGTRLGLERPKCLVDVLGKSVIEWQLESLRDADVVVVVGFKSDEVIEHLMRVRPDCRVAHNDEFASTGTSASLAIGASVAREYVISLDGDLLVAEKDLRDFVAASTPGLVGVTGMVSTTAVGVAMDEDGVVDQMGFDVDSPWEWSGLLRMPQADVERFGRGHVFESLLPHLPLPSRAIECVEIDEPHDILRAEAWLAARIEAWGSYGS